MCIQTVEIPWYFWVVIRHWVANAKEEQTEIQELGLSLLCPDTVCIILEITGSPTRDLQDSENHILISMWGSSCNICGCYGYHSNRNLSDLLQTSETYNTANTVLRLSSEESKTTSPFRRLFLVIKYRTGVVWWKMKLLHINSESIQHTRAGVQKTCLIVWISQDWMPGPLKHSPMTHYYQKLLHCEEPDCQTSLHSWTNASNPLLSLIGHNDLARWTLLLF